MVLTMTMICAIVWTCSLNPTAFAQAETSEEAGAASEQGEIVARVADEVITRSELNKLIDVVEETTGQLDLSFEEEKLVLEEMVKRRVLFVLAKRDGVQVSAEDVKGEIDRGKQDFPSEEAYKEWLKSHGLEEEEISDRVRQHMVIRRFVDSKTKDLAVSEEEIADHYQKMKDAGELDRADFAHILVRVEGEGQAAEDTTKARIEAARKRIVEGEDFGTVAREVSEDAQSAARGGAYRRVRRGTLPPELDARVFEAAIGELSEPFRTQKGWHILRVTNRDVPGLEEVHDLMRSGLLVGKKVKVIGELVDQARKDMKIEILLTPEGEKPEQPAGTDPLDLLEQSI